MGKINSFGESISILIDIYKDINYSEYQAKKALSMGKMGLYQKHKSHILYQKRKAYGIKKDLKDLLQSRKIFEFEYTLNNLSHKGRLVVSSSKEIEDYLHFMSITQGYELKILEIKEIPTFISESPLS